MEKVLRVVRNQLERKIVALKNKLVSCRANFDF
jgi:hypothetical protein